MMKLVKIKKYFNILVLFVGLLVPLLLFLNRFLIPDFSYDTTNYHLYLGQSGVETENNKFEFYPTGIHNFSSILEIPGYVSMRIFGYRLGSIVSLIFIYLSVWILYKIFRLYQPKLKIWNTWWWSLIFVSAFLSYEAFLQIAMYFVDIEVAFLSLLTLYLLLKYEKTKNVRSLIFSTLVMSILFLGKMTAGFMLPAYFLYLLFILVSDKKLIWKQKLYRLFLSGILVISFSIPWWYQNYVKTGNPVFPYYNTIFKSKLYPEISFTQEGSGGDTTFEKFAWGIVSIKRPTKLGQAHDLFNDYKINIYFILAIIILIWSWFKKDKELLKLSFFYLISYELWAWVFGYLRYGIFLEFLGGIIILIWFCRLKGWGKYIIILPIFGFMFLQSKRVVNLSLAYDLSFRPGYFYNRLDYPKEMTNFAVNKISVDPSLIEKYKPVVYLNCATPNTLYQVMSDFSKLPMLNIDREYYAGMTSNQLYKNNVKNYIQMLIHGEKFNFVTVTTVSGLNVNYDKCLSNLKSKNYKILDEYDTNFLGYNGQKLKVIFGEFNW